MPPATKLAALCEIRSGSHTFFVVAQKLTIQKPYFDLILQKENKASIRQPLITILLHLTLLFRTATRAF